MDIFKSVQKRYNSAQNAKGERESTMGRKPLSPDEIALLRSSPYVECVVCDKIHFTPEFKRTMYEELVNGKTVRVILQEHSIDPNILGDRRIWGIAEKLRANADRDEGFQDLRSDNCRKQPRQTEEQILAAKVEQLEHELAYTRQEVEFLKKIHTADLEARKSWESKLHRK